MTSYERQGYLQRTSENMLNEIESNLESELDDMYRVYISKDIYEDFKDAIICYDQESWNRLSYLMAGNKERD
jgi:hypothetical protein